MSDEKTTEEGLDNTNMVANVLETGDLHEVNMILGSRERIRHAGVIRPGIKIPLSGCSEQQKALYKRLLDEGHGFEYIDAEMLAIAPKGYTKKTCLRPSNSDYFTIRDEDFKRPQDAEYIRTHYADPDGKVRRIPCWIPVSDISKAIPHNFRAFSAGGLRCVSFYEDGRLKFRYLPKGFTGNPKPDDWKILDSDDEDNASKVCGIDVKFGGMYRVYVPGTRGAGEIICPTQSWNGLAESVGVLKRTRSIMGRFDGLFNGQAFFELCKVQETVKTPDGKRQQQWIVTLELAVDPMELARYAEPQAVAARSLHALSALTGAAVPAPVLPAPIFNNSTPAAACSSLPLDDDLPPLGAEPAAEPEAAAAEAAVDPQVLAGRKALNDLMASQHLFMCDADNMAAQTYGGRMVDDLGLQELREFYKSIQKSIEDRGDSFAADVIAMRAA